MRHTENFILVLDGLVSDTEIQDDRAPPGETLEPFKWTIVGLSKGDPIMATQVDECESSVKSQIVGSMKCNGATTTVVEGVYATDDDRTYHRIQDIGSIHRC